MNESGQTNFIILFQGRSGSSFLIDALNRHPEIFAAGELLADTAPNANASSSFVRRIGAGVRRFYSGCPSERQIEATRLFYKTLSTDKRVVGFKTKISDVINLHALKVILEDRYVRTIIMERRNLVKQAISRLNAERLYEATSEWNLFDAGRRPSAFEVEESEFDRTLQSVIFDYRVLNAFTDYLDLPTLRLEYADLLRDREAWFNAVFAFLGVEPRVLESKLLKNTDVDLRNVVKNIDELKERYKGTEFELMFDN